jgi:hypothetical protein
MPVQNTYSIAPARAVNGQLACRRDKAEIDTAYNGEASAAINFGLGVKWGSATDKDSVKLPTAETDKIRGMTVRLHTYDPGDQGDITASGVSAGAKLNILKAGEIFVTCDTGCAPGDKLWIRAVGGGDHGGGVPERVGAPENADDSTDMIDCTALGEWQEFAAAGSIAKLRVRFF